MFFSAKFGDNFLFLICLPTFFRSYFGIAKLTVLIRRFLLKVRINHKRYFPLSYFRNCHKDNSVILRKLHFAQNFVRNFHHIGVGTFTLLRITHAIPYIIERTRFEPNDLFAFATHASLLYTFRRICTDTSTYVRICDTHAYTHTRSRNAERNT